MQKAGSQCVISDGLGQNAAAYLGTWGRRFCEFCCDVDSQHPDLLSLYDSSFDFKSEFAITLDEVIFLMHRTDEEGMRYAQHLLSKAFLSKLSPEIKRIDSPFKNQQHVRLLKHREDRDRMRLYKAVKPLSLAAFAKNSNRIWDGVPDTFNLYIRNSDVYLSEVVKAEAKINRFKDLGCLESADLIAQDVETFVERFRETHYGFHKISITDAAIVLAKMHRGSMDQQGLVTIPYSQIEPTLLRDEHSTILHAIEKTSDVCYTPYIYPLHEFFCLSPPSISRCIDRLENALEAGGRAIFDHYLVVFPRVSLKYCFPDFISEDVQSRMIFDFYRQAVIDYQLSPVLLGECDGKCYFIAYWYDESGEINYG